MMPDRDDRLHEGEDEFKQFQDIVPENSMVEVAFRVAGYIDEEGTPRFSYQAHGDSEASRVLGIIELGKIQYMHDWQLQHPTQSEIEDEEDD